METNFDLIVVGGGIAGVSAALSASRCGLKVALVEKTSLLGGLATNGLISWYEPLCDGLGNQIIYSQAEELLKLAIKQGTKSVDEKWLNNESGSGRFATVFDPNIFSLNLTKLMNENKVTIFFEAMVCDVKINGRNIDNIVCYGVEGKFNLFAKIFVDATGNGYLSRMSGLEYFEGKNYLTYAMSKLNENNEPRMVYSGASLDGTNHPDGVRLFSGLTQKDNNEYLLKAQLLALEEIESGKKQKISNIPDMPQYRKIAAIKGEYVMTNNDANIHHFDSCGAFATFSKIGEYYEIPFDALHNNKIKNLYFSGRIISSIDDAWEATRVIPVCALTGEITGIASYLQISDLLNIENLQNYLIKRKIKLHF